MLLSSRIQTALHRSVSRFPMKLPGTQIFRKCSSLHFQKINRCLNEFQEVGCHHGIFGRQEHPETMASRDLHSELHLHSELQCHRGGLHLQSSTSTSSTSSTNRSLSINGNLHLKTQTGVPHKSSTPVTVKPTKNGASFTIDHTIIIMVEQSKL